MNLLRNRVLLFFVISLASFAKSSSQHLPESKHKIVVIAHRGNHVSVPENTIAACKEAIAVGVDYVEVDLRTTKDGHLVVLHDAKVDRTTNGQGKVSDMTFSEVKDLQVFNQNRKTHRIPEFKDVLLAAKGKINIYLDFKDADVAHTFKQIEEAGMTKHVVVYLNKKEQYVQWKHVAPQIPLMTSIPDEMKNEEGLKTFLKETKVNVLDNLSDPVLIKVANEHGVAVWLDVQDPNEGPVSWKNALHKGLNGMQTDKPEGLVNFLKQESL